MCKQINVQITFELIVFNIKCGNYGVGGDYWAHMDRNKDPIRGPEGTGDRVATVVNILQAPESGI